MSDPAIQLSIIVPCYNEARNLPGTIRELDHALDMARVISRQLVLVDDCSTDDTAAVMDGFAARHSDILVVRNPVNLGFGGAYRAGVVACQGEYVMLVPGDDAHPADGMAPLMALLGQADMVLTRVTNPQVRPWWRQWVSRAYTRLVNGLFGFDIPYYNGLSIHRRSLLVTLPEFTSSFGFNAEIIVRMLHQGATHVTVGVAIRDRRDGFSRAFALGNIYRTLAGLWALKRAVQSPIRPPRS